MLVPFYSIFHYHVTVGTFLAFVSFVPSSVHVVKKGMSASYHMRHTIIWKANFPSIKIIDMVVSCRLHGGIVLNLIQDIPCRGKFVSDVLGGMERHSSAVQRL